MEAFSFLAWLLGRSCFISPLYWGRHCINRHSGNRPSLSAEPLRRGPGPMARFPTLRYRPWTLQTSGLCDVLWNPSTLWEGVVRNSRVESFESAHLLDLRLESYTGNCDALKLFLLQPKHSFIYYPFTRPCLIYCVALHPQQLYTSLCVGLSACCSPPLFSVMLSQFCCTWTDMFSPKTSTFLTRC